MADFVQSTNVKSAVRKLASPIPDVAAFNTIFQSVIIDNPFEFIYLANAPPYFTLSHIWRLSILSS